MDRKIKFRVWDELLEEMVGTGMHVIGESFCCQRIEAWIRDHESEKGMLERYNDMVVMEWTGLQDKEGNDIYEGDIIEWYGNNFLVWFYKGSFLIWDDLNVNVLKTPHDSIMGYARNSEVIGNKFEDPELLDK